MDYVLAKIGEARMRELLNEAEMEGALRVARGRNRSWIRGLFSRGPGSGATAPAPCCGEPCCA